MNIEKWLINNFDKEKDRVLITGASSGIGKEYLLYFAKLGCNAVIVSNEKELNGQVAKSVSEEFNVSIEPLYCDLSDLKQTEELIQDIQGYSFPVFISNAGFGIKGDFLSVEQDKYKKIVGVNVLAPTILTYDLVGKMKQKNCGVLITIASINVVSPIPNNTVYTATKAYLYSFSLALSKENEKTNIIFQTLLPGTTDTPFHDKQGAVPRSLTMKPGAVVERSLSHLNDLVCIPNAFDRIAYPLAALLPVGLRMSLASFVLKKRLGV